MACKNVIELDMEGHWSEAFEEDQMIWSEVNKDYIHPAHFVANNASNIEDNHSNSNSNINSNVSNTSEEQESKAKLVNTEEKNENSDCYYVGEA